MWEDEPSEDDIERELNQGGPPTIKAPDPSYRATRVAEWLKDPPTMLVHLTETLNALLSCCRYRYFDQAVIEVNSDEIDPMGILVCAIIGQLLTDIEILRIRNSIQATPLNLEFIDDVRKHFVVCIQPPVQLQSLHELTDAITHYKFQLQILADWIEAQAIYLNKKQPQKNAEENDTNRAEDVKYAALAIGKSGKKVTKDSVGKYIRKVLKKPIANNLLNKELGDLRKEWRKSGPQ